MGEPTHNCTATFPSATALLRERLVRDAVAAGVEAGNAALSRVERIKNSN